MALLPFSNATGANRVLRAGDTMTGKLTISSGGLQVTGNIGNTAISPSIGVLVAGTPFTGTNQFGSDMAFTSTSGAITTIIGYYTKLTGGTGTFTTLITAGVYVDTFVKGASQTVTSAAGLYVAAQSAAVTTSYGLIVAQISGGTSNNYGIFITAPSGTGAIGLQNNGTTSLGAKITTYNNITTAGWGMPAIYGAGRSTAQTGAVATVASYTVGGADGSFYVSANVLVTTSTTHNFTVTCTYTDEGNTSRTLTLTFSQLGGTLLTAITNVTGAGPYEGVPLHIRAKASTSITIATTGTFTTVTYNVEGQIIQTA